MGRLFIVVLAAVGTVWKIDPAMRPYIDAAMLSLVCAFTFYLGDIVSGWLDRWEAKPHWKKLRRCSKPTRAARHRAARQSGASMPLLER